MILDSDKSELNNMLKGSSILIPTSPDAISPIKILSFNISTLSSVSNNRETLTASPQSELL